MTGGGAASTVQKALRLAVGGFSLLGFGAVGIGVLIGMDGNVAGGAIIGVFGLAFSADDN